PDLGGEDLQVEGLGDEVVAAHLHGHDDVHVVRGGGEEDDGGPAELAELGAPVVAVAAGQADVQQHQVGIAGGELPGHIGEVPAPHRLPAPGLDVPGHRGGDGLVVLHQKNLVHARPPVKANL